MTEGFPLASWLAALGRALPSYWLMMTAWTGGLLVIALVLDHLLARRVGPGMRMTLYLAVLVRVVLPPDWQAPLGVVPVAASPIDASPAITAVPEATTPVSIAAPFAVHGESTAPPLPGRSGLGWLAAYGLGVLGLAGLLGHRISRLSRVRAQSVATELGIAGIPVMTHRTAGPMAVGLVAPRIIVPHAMLETLPQPVLDAVLRHEASHVRHRDGWSAIALALSCCVAWPLIPVWIAAARIRLLMELRADAAVVTTCAAPVVGGYRKLLLELAQQRWMHSALAPALGPVGQLRARLKAMKRGPAMPWLLQLGFVAPLAATLVIAAGRGEPETDEPPIVAASEAIAAPATPLAPGEHPVPYPYCREHASVMGIPGAPEQSRGSLVTTFAMAVSHIGEIDMLDAGLEAAMREVPSLSAGQVAELHYVAGLAYAARGRTIEAIPHLAEASWAAAMTEYDALASDAAAMLVVMHERVGKLDEARSWGAHATAARRRVGFAGPMHIEMAESLARILEKSGNEQAAALQRALGREIDAGCEVVVPFPPKLQSTLAP